MLQAKLVVVGGKVKSQEVALKLPTVIGRGNEATLKIPLALVSRRHCEIREREGRLYIRDLGSTNGTYVNNYKISAEQPLMPGELVTIGTVTFRAEYQTAPRPEPMSAATQPGLRTTVKPNSSARQTTNGLGTGSGSVPLEIPDQVPSPAIFFDSTVAGTMSVTVAPGQPVKLNEAPAPAAQVPAATHATSPKPARNRRGTTSPSFTPPDEHVLSDFPLQATPQKSISLSAVDQLQLHNLHQVSFLGDLTFGEANVPQVDQPVKIDLGETGHQPTLNEAAADSRLDSFLRGIARPIE